MEYLIPSGLELRETASYGRGVFSKRDLLPGAEVLTSQPFAHVVSSTSRGAVCDSCLVSSEFLMKCSQCKYIYYCGQNCQKRDWPLHRVECKSLVAIQPHIPSDTMRLVVRVLQRKRIKKKKLKKEGSERQGSLSDQGREIDYLTSNKDSLRQDVREELAFQLTGINKFMSSNPDYNTDEAYEVLCKVLCNTFYILDWSMDAVAAGLYLVPSLLNHSCYPNCVVVYNGLQLSLRSVKKVKSGEQLFISYTELLETRERRQLHLNRVYSFQCDCSRCHGEDDKASGLLAAASEGGVSSSVLEDSIREGLKKIDEEMKRMKKAKDWRGVIDLCRILHSRYMSILSPLNIVMIKLKQEILEAKLELQQWTEALETAEQLLKPYQHHLPKYHPCIAVHLIKVAKLRRVIATTEQLELSVRDLSQAMDVLVVCHGASHPLTNEVQLLQKDSQGELVRRQTA